MNFFGIDGPFQKYGTIVFDLIFLNILWLFISLFSFGILMGNATVALYYTLNNCIVNDVGYPLKTFFLLFKKRFLKIFIFSLSIIFISLIIVYNISLVINGVVNVPWLLPIYAAILVYIVLILPYNIALLAKEEFKYKKIFIYSIILAIKHFPTTILCFIINVLLIAGIYYTNFLGLLFLVSPTLTVFSILITEKILPHYNLSSLAENINEEK